jgi:4-hydroxy-tetrahydrodipicolinate synthase
MTETRPLSGVYCPALTPVNADLSLNTAAFIEHCRWLLDDGCHGLAVFGTTSEANSFSVDERMAALDALVEAGIAPTALLPGTGCCAITDTARLTAQAVALGCAGVLMLPPFYYKGMSEDGLFASFAETIERVGSDKLRVYLYHIPQVSGVGLPLALVERLVKAYPDTVVGLKDSSGDWSYTENLLKAIPGFGAFSGSEVFLLANLRAGGAGTISATTNVNARAIRDLYDNWTGDAAGAMQDGVTRRRELIQGFPLITGLKHIVAALRGDPSWRRTRPPLTPVDEAVGARLLGELAADGLVLGRQPEAASA